MMKGFRINTIFLSVLICALWISAFVVLTNRLENDSAAEQHEALEKALERDITTCYALEGHFPPDLQYLEENYGLQINTNDYYVTYDIFASNQPPSVRVTPKQ